MSTGRFTNHTVRLILSQLVTMSSFLVAVFAVVVTVAQAVLPSLSPSPVPDADFPGHVIGAFIGATFGTFIVWNIVKFAYNRSTGKEDDAPLLPL